jgi:hypothetical protein
MRAIAIAVLAITASGLLSPAAGNEPTFYDDDPLWVVPVTQSAAGANYYEPDIPYDYFINYFDHRTDRRSIHRSRNVNTVDEVPDCPFFVNRAGRIPLTPELVARAANTGDGPAAGRWEIVSGKTDGVTPGFTVRDATGTKWFLKFDPRGWLGMATGSEIIGAKLFWALGFFTAEYYIVRFQPSDLAIADGAMVKLPGKAKRPMRPEDIDRLLGRCDRESDGSYRAIASKAVPGRYVGRIRFEGTRADDPNDLVPHEDHRELRACFVFCAWLNHVDIKRDQSLATVVTEGGHTFIRRYLLDWGSILGSSAVGPRKEWEGYEPMFEPGWDIATRAFTLGLIIPPWRLMAFDEYPAIGRLPRDESSWDPERWQPYISNPAFRHMRADDAFWAARKMTFITEEIVRAVVAEAQFGDPVGEEHLVKDIMARRARILSTYLTAINPIVDPVLGRDGGLSFRNAAVEFAGAEAPRGYRAVWSAFDNETGATTLIGTTEGSGTAVQAPALPATSFLKVELACVGAPRASWEVPITLYFRERSGSWELVGLERMRDDQEERE